MTNFKTQIKLDRLHCYDEGDGPGDAEPYLWVVFFKADGETLVFDSDAADFPGSLKGSPVVVSTPGSHGNLGTTDVDEGDDVAIPSIIGEFNTTMMPVPFSTPLFGKTDTPGLLGCLVVLMEQDNTPDGAAAHGHEALDASVRDKLAEILKTITLAHPNVTDDDIAAKSGEIADGVTAAVASDVNIWDAIGGLFNEDDQIGTAVFKWTQQDLADANGAPINFSKRWDNEGSWELYGHVTATPIPEVESKCCVELRQKIAALQEAVDAQNQRLQALESKNPPPPK